MKGNSIYPLPRGSLINNKMTNHSHGKWIYRIVLAGILVLFGLALAGQAPNASEQVVILIKNLEIVTAILIVTLAIINLIGRRK